MGSMQDRPLYDLFISAMSLLNEVMAHHFWLIHVIKTNEAHIFISLH